MLDLHKEAEEYFGKGTKIHGEFVYPKEYAIKKLIEFATNSKYVQAEKLKAQIEVLELIKREYNHDEAMIFWINNEIAFLNKYLSKLENEND